MFNSASRLPLCPRVGTLTGISTFWSRSTLCPVGSIRSTRTISKTATTKKRGWWIGKPGTTIRSKMPIRLSLPSWLTRAWSQRTPMRMCGYINPGAGASILSDLSLTVRRIVDFVGVQAAAVISWDGHHQLAGRFGLQGPPHIEARVLALHVIDVMAAMPLVAKREFPTAPVIRQRRGAINIPDAVLSDHEVFQIPRQGAQIVVHVALYHPLSRAPGA